METVNEIYQRVCKQRKQHSLANEQNENERARLHANIDAALKAMNDAMAADDMQAYHAAEAALSYAQRKANTFEFKPVAWSKDEVSDISRQIVHAFNYERREKCKQAYALIVEAQEILSFINGQKNTAQYCLNIVNKDMPVKERTSYGFAGPIVIPYDVVRDLAQAAGEPVKYKK